MYFLLVLFINEHLFIKYLNYDVITLMYAKNKKYFLLKIIKHIDNNRNNIKQIYQ